MNFGDKHEPDDAARDPIEAAEADSWHNWDESAIDEEEEVSLATAVTPSKAETLSPELSWNDEEIVNPNKGLSFSAPAKVPGEEWVPLNQLKVWEHHPAKTSRLRGENFEALCVSANDPANLPPLTVLRTEAGIVILKGRRRHYALEQVHGTDSDINVRCLFFSGTEEDAVQWVADDALGGVPRSQIEIARAVLNLQRVAGISQKAITERYPILRKDQVSRMTIAARTVERFGNVFNLLAEPDRVPIDLCVKFAQFMKSATPEMQAEVLENAELRESEGVSLKASDLFAALGIEIEVGAKTKASVSSEESDALETIPVLGFDDQPVGAVEKLDERVMRLQLPDPTTMTPDEREIAAQAFIAEIRAYFGLKVAG